MSDPTHPPSRQEPALASLPLTHDDARGDARPFAPPRFPWLPVVGLIVIAVAAIVFWRMQVAPPATPGPVAEAPAPPPPVAAGEAPPAIRYPIDAAQAGAESTPAMPAPDGATLVAGLLALPGAAGLDRLIVTDDAVHRFVATIDNLPRATVASKVMFVRPAEGAFAVDIDEGRTAIGRGNASRYAPYLRTLQSVDTGALAALYVRNYSMFQQAYRDLGYPNGYFNDRLVDVIDHLLAAPEPAEAVTLLQPRVLYEFANPDL